MYSTLRRLGSAPLIRVTVILTFDVITVKISPLPAPMYAQCCLFLSLPKITLLRRNFYWIVMTLLRICIYLMINCAVLDAE